MAAAFDGQQPHLGLWPVPLHLRNAWCFKCNHKRVYRIYRELEFNLRIRLRKRLLRDTPEPLAVPASPDVVWFVDFMHEQFQAAQ